MTADLTTWYSRFFNITAYDDDGWSDHYALRYTCRRISTITTRIAKSAICKTMGLLGVYWHWWIRSYSHSRQVEVQIAATVETWEELLPFTAELLEHRTVMTICFGCSDTPAVLSRARTSLYPHPELRLQYGSDRLSKRSAGRRPDVPKL
jgi:hypothetical protein